MDVLAHALWSNVLLKGIPPTRYKTRAARWGMFFGVLPDLVSFGPLFVYYVWQLATGRATYTAGPPVHLSGTPLFKYASVSYNFSHSLVIWLITLLIIWAVLKKFPWPFLAWGLHIGIDIFSHTKEFFATPFLFPISDFKVSVISWSDPVFMLVNYGLLLLIYLFIISRLKADKAGDT